MPQSEPPWEAPPFPEAEPAARQDSHRAPLRTRPERHSDQQQSVGKQAMAKVAGSIPGLQLDKAGEPVFENDQTMVAYMQRMIDSGFLGNHLKTPAQAINAMSVCKSANLPWPLYINKTYFIGDKLAVYVDFMVAAAHATGQLERYHVQWFNDLGEEKDEKNARGFRVFSCKATVKHQEREDVQTVVYSLDDVTQAGFTNPNYKKHPSDMLMWRAVARALRTQFPMCTGGALAQGIDDMVAVTDGDGRQVLTDEGVPVFQQRRARARKALEAALAMDGSDQGGEA